MGNRAGLYLTVIFHLMVIIALLIHKIDSTIKAETSFVLDFSKQEEIERQQELEEMKTAVSDKLDRMIAVARSQQSNIRNIAVDASAPLKDDRNTDAEQLYKDAERLAKELREGQNAIQEDAREETVELPSQQNGKGDGKNGAGYSGPSVLSYRLDGRKASHLPIPAYRCLGSGDVVVIISVDPQGRVVGAEIMDALSSSDKCLRNFAIRAARNSRFSVSTTAPNRQNGEIVYRFIAQ